MTCRKIISHSDPIPNYGYIEIIGGDNDGLRFTLVTVKFEDGEGGAAYICNNRPGYFRNVFVPWESSQPMVPPS